MSPKWTANPSLVCRTTVPRNTVLEEPMKKAKRNCISVWISIDVEAGSMSTPERDRFSVRPLPAWGVADLS